jgi:hypothetical protein
MPTNLPTCLPGFPFLSSGELKMQDYWRDPVSAAAAAADAGLPAGAPAGDAGELGY